MAWTVEYNANQIPSEAIPAWTPVLDPDPLVSSTVEISPAGILHVSGLVANAEAIEWDIEPAFVASTGLTIEFRMRVITGDLLASETDDVQIRFSTDTTETMEVDIYSNGISTITNAITRVSYSFDTTDDYHVYRITQQGTTVKVYVDSILRLEAVAVEGVATPILSLVPTQSGSNFEQNWDYIYWRTDGDYAPEIETTSFMKLGKYW